MAEENDYSIVLRTRFNQTVSFLEKLKDVKLPKDLKAEHQRLLDLYKMDEEYINSSDEDQNSGLYSIIDPVTPTETFEEKLLDNDQNATTLTSRASVNGWLSRKHILSFRHKFYALVYKGSLYLYKGQNSDKPDETLILHGGEFISKNKDFFDLKVWSKTSGKKETHNFKLLNIQQFDLWKNVIETEIQKPPTSRFSSASLEEYYDGRYCKMLGVFIHLDFILTPGKVKEICLFVYFRRNWK